MTADRVEWLLGDRVARLASIALEQELTIAIHACERLLDLTNRAADQVATLGGDGADALRRDAWAAVAELRAGGHAMCERTKPQ